MNGIVARWEWRTFGDDFGAADEAFAALSSQGIEESDELYVVSEASDASVKVRDALMDVKHLQDVDDDGLEQWLPTMRESFPLPAVEVRSVLTSLRAPERTLEHAAYTLDDLVGEIVRPNEALLAVGVHKRRARYTVDGCLAELSELRADDGSTRTIAVESEDPARVLATVRALGLASRPNTCMARGLKTLLGFGASRFAVIDVGTNSVKLHIGERHADGTWSTFVDKATVTRLGQGLDAARTLQPGPMKRTSETIAAFADESRHAGVASIAAVGTAGLRASANGLEFVEVVEARCGVRIEIISGEEEARLAYLGATSGILLVHSSLVVFDTGGGSSQFTFGHSGAVDEQFSVPVGAARLTERLGLDGIVSDEALAEALSAIAAELGHLDGRATPAVLVGMGGAVTNLAAVKHGLNAYDPEVVQGTQLEREEIDRQIELYRTRTADERRVILGLQPSRAEVILAGACVVRTILTKLGCESLVVSDRGLRHGLIIDRFALGPPVG